MKRAQRGASLTAALMLHHNEVSDNSVREEPVSPLP